MPSKVNGKLLTFCFWLIVLSHDVFLLVKITARRPQMTHSWLFCGQYCTCQELFVFRLRLNGQEIALKESNTNNGWPYYSILRYSTSLVLQYISKGVL